jgi:vacuolar-type H+-ATPase subunit I/STV1
MSGMKGMTQKDDPCVVFLFEGWLIDTKGKLAAAILGTIAMGVKHSMLGYALKLWNQAYPVKRRVSYKFILCCFIFSCHFSYHSNSLDSEREKMSPIFATYQCFFFFVVCLFVCVCVCFVLLSFGQLYLTGDVPRFLLYAIQVTNGYFLMLLAMTYSGLLLFAVVFGLALGQLLFNRGKAPAASCHEQVSDGDSDPHAFHKLKDHSSKQPGSVKF